MVKEVKKSAPVHILQLQTYKKQRINLDEKGKQ